MIDGDNGARFPNCNSFLWIIHLQESGKIYQVEKKGKIFWNRK